MTYSIKAVLMVGSIKMLETLHVVFVDDLIEEFIDIFDRECTDCRAVRRFSRIRLALCKHPIKNVITWVGTYLLSKMGPGFTDICSLENIEYLVPCSPLPSLFCENTLQGHLHVRMQPRVFGTEPDYSCVESLSIQSFPLDCQEVNETVALKGMDVLHRV